MKVKVFLVLMFFSAAAWGQQSGFGKAAISIPGVTGSLELDAGPTAWEARVRPDGQETQLQAMSRPDHLLVTAFLQHVAFAASAERCRDEWWPLTEKGTKEHHVKMEHLQQTSQEGIARVEYLIPELVGRPIRQHVVHAYLGARDLCAEIHLSKVTFVADDQKLFDEVMASARLRTDDSGRQEQAQVSQATEYIGQASRFYMQHNYPAAAERYQKALDLEKQKHTVGKAVFRVLVDNLGMS